MRETWYVLEDGSVVDPAEVSTDENGALVHSGGIPVAMRGQTASSRGVELDANRKIIIGRQMQASQPGTGYLTRGSEGGGQSDSPEAIAAAEIAALRDTYVEKIGKRPFNGWDAATLREKIAEHDKNKVD